MNIKKQSNALYVIIFTILLDAIGVGLILPILPDLLRHFSAKNMVTHYGIFISLYALFQIFFSPILGALSDRLGRRPILLLSLAGAAIDYCFMAFAPTIILLYIGRIISGITGANMTVANAYIADITPHKGRAKRYGLVSAGFGIGFIIGPALGGFLGAISLHLPFLIAAGANALNFLMALFILPESLKKRTTRAITLKKLNPFSSLAWTVKIKGILPYLTVYVIFLIAGLVPQTLWIIYCEDKFAWNPQQIGFSLAFFGLCMAFAQALFVTPMINQFGEKKTIIIAVSVDIASYIALAFMTKGWMLAAIIPIFALASIAQPAMQSLISKTVHQSQQGELQGSLTSLLSLSSIICPLISTSIYAATLHIFSGTIWLITGFVYFIALPIVASFKNSEACHDDIHTDESLQ